jgi:LPS-assembly protein
VFNRVTRLGTFDNATGFAQLGEKPEQKSLFGTLEPDVYFWGTKIAKIGPKSYQLTDGGFTTCVQPSRRWEMTSAKGTVTLDKSVVMRNVILKVKDVPFLYLPGIYYPINKEGRSTGFLLPQYSSSSIYGQSISNAFFWAISRSQDATFFHDYHSKTGQGLGTEYRYVGDAGSRGNILFNMQNQHSGVPGEAPTSTTHDYGLNGDVNQALPHGFRAYGTARYTNNISFNQQYQNIDVYSRRSSSFGMSVSGNAGPYRLSGTVDRNDYFDGNNPGARTGRAPSVDVSMSDRAIGKTKIYFGASGNTSYFVRQDDLNDPTTNRSLWRFDGGPSIRAPLSSLPFLSATGSASWRLTRWMETKDPVSGQNLPVPLTRQLFTLSSSVVGPTFARIFDTPNNGYAERFKHLIEPSFTISWLSPFDQTDRVVQTDYTDSQVGGTTNIRYGLSNRFLARRKSKNPAPNAAPIVREFLSIDLTQSYYTDARAQIADPNNLTTNTASKFSAVQMRASSRPTDLASMQFNMDIDPKYKEIRTINASGALESLHARVSAGWAKKFVVPGLDGYDALTATNALNASTTIKTRTNNLGGTYDFYFDVKNGGFLQQRVMAYYNSQCCGISVDWQSYQTPNLAVAANRTFAVAFTLAGIGSFSNPLGSFGAR